MLQEENKYIQSKKFSEFYEYFSMTCDVLC